MAPIDELIKGLNASNAREFLDRLSELNGGFLEALTAEVAYGFSCEADPLSYIYKWAARAKPMDEAEDTSDTVLDEEFVE